MEFNLMPFQNEPFNGDIFLASQFLEVAHQKKCNIAIETGTCMGGTTTFLSRHFDSVVTIEANADYYIEAKKNLVACSYNTTMINGLSEVELENAILLFKEETPIMFFLDAHWGDSCPLLQELNIIATFRRFRNDVVVIHDFKVPNRPELGFDSYGGHDFDLEYVSQSLDNIFGKNNWVHFYNTENSDGAKRGVLFAHKK